MSESGLQRLRKRFYLDRKNGWIAGVCAGAAATLHTDPAFLRVGFVLAGLFVPKVAIAVYLVAWILLDERVTSR
jgi:phage shock protein PspC (stress-responsive transcriptional regulator)